jgi:hypothetical protein
MDAVVVRLVFPLAAVGMFGAASGGVCSAHPSDAADAAWSGSTHNLERRGFMKQEGRVRAGEATRNS